MSTPVHKPAVGLVDVGTFRPENRVPAEYYAGHAATDESSPD
ncbi:MAG: hypothetical protein ACRDTK_06185 [Mycobacterium sp.]